MILTPMLTLCPRYADLAPGTVPLSGQEVRVVPNDPDMPIPVAFSGPSSSEGSALPVPVEDRVVAHAHCPVVTVNGPGPIVGQDYDRIVLGWTEGTTGRRALEAAAEEAALRGSLLSIVTIPPTAPLSPALPPEGINVEQVLIDAMRRIESTYPA